MSILDLFESKCPGTKDLRNEGALAYLCNSMMKYAFHELRCEQVLHSFWALICLQVFDRLYNDFLQKTQAVVIFSTVLFDLVADANVFR